MYLHVHYHLETRNNFKTLFYWTHPLESDCIDVHVYVTDKISLHYTCTLAISILVVSKNCAWIKAFGYNVHVQCMIVIYTQTYK